MPYLKHSIMHTKKCSSDQQYVNSTTRFIHERIREHVNNENSSVTKHIYSYQNEDYKGIEFKIIQSESNPANLPLYEEFILESVRPHSIPEKNVPNL